MNGGAAPSRKVLVAEANPMTRLLLARLLQDMRVELELASDGEEVMGKARDYYDLVILGCGMACLDERDVVRRLMDCHGRGVIDKLIVVGDEQDRHRAQMVGCRQFFTKPFDLAGLRRAALRQLGLEAWKGAKGAEGCA